MTEEANGIIVLDLVTSVLIHHEETLERLIDNLEEMVNKLKKEKQTAVFEEPLHVYREDSENIPQTAITKGSY